MIPYAALMAKKHVKLGFVGSGVEKIRLPEKLVPELPRASLYQGRRRHCSWRAILPA